MKQLETWTRTLLLGRILSDLLEFSRLRVAKTAFSSTSLVSATCRVVELVLLSVVFYSGSSSQVYPRWFLSQGDFRCPQAVVGYANASFYPDSAVAYARRSGIINLARNRHMEIKGGQIFWSTEAGTFWMGSDFREQFDTSAVELVASSIRVLDRFVTKDFVAVLLGDSTCRLDDVLRKMLFPKALSSPWVESLPSDDRYYYAVGLSPEYYYESSSWTEAEKLARRNLARSVYISIKSLQKAGREGQEIKHEEMSVSLRGIEVVARWRDVEKQVFYVLIRAPKTH